MLLLRAEAEAIGSKKLKVINAQILEPISSGAEGR
jgi:hypothetical protein